MAKTGGEWQEVQANFFKLTTPGDACQGVLVDKKLVDSTLPGQEGRKQTVYTLIQADGSPIFVGGRGKSNPQVIPGLEQVKMGSEVKVVYEKEVPAKSKGFHPGKVVKVYTNGKINTEVLAEYINGKGGTMVPVGGAEDESDNPFDA